MLISKHWLRDFVFLPDALDAPDLGRKLSLAVAEVEKVTELAKNFEHIVVGKIISVAAHPDADKLKVCVVDCGEEQLSIVCGGSNVAEGMLVVVGKIGAKVRWHGQGDLIELALTKIRGVESSGMICAAEEIGLGERFPKRDEKEILDLSHLSVRPGTPVAEALGLDDVIFEIENKSLTNRPDLWGHYGLAREIAALTRKKFTEIKPIALKGGKEQVLTVHVAAPDLCPRYEAVIIDGVSGIESPAWLRDRLAAVGQRSINAIVDLTNYILFELGQPLHAFDAQVLRGSANEINLEVRQATAGEAFENLDAVSVALPEGALVIAHAGVPVAVAGIKGGLHSGVTPLTTQIVLEAATFNATAIRKTASSLGWRTEASMRFEKSLDPELTALALARFVELGQKIWPKMKLVSKIVDIKSETTKKITLEFPIARISERLGVTLADKTIIDILERLGFELNLKKGLLRVGVPSWRATKDITIFEDIVEEVARLYGYENIPGVLPECVIVPPAVNRLRQLERELKEILAFELALTETTNYSFVSPEWLERLGLVGETTYLALDNPIAKDRPWLRRSLIPGLLHNVTDNAHTEKLGLFECGRVYLGDEAGERTDATSSQLLPAQPLHVGLLYTSKTETEPLYVLTETLRTVAARLGLDLHLENDTDASPLAHPGRAAKIVVSGVVVGQVFELHPAQQSALGFGARVAVAELSVTVLETLPRQLTQYQALREFPEVTRDLAFVVEKSVTHEQITTAILTADSLVLHAELFDVYSAVKGKPDHKSLAYHITLGADHTLTSAEIDSAVATIQAKLTKQFTVEWRA